jgi:hypothetical protein
MKKMKILYRIFIIVAFALFTLPAKSEIVIAPLFEYPTAPDTISALNERSNYLMEHFWDQMDFNRKTTVDQIALNDAFSVYITAMRFADADPAEKSVTKILERTAKNPVLAIQFTKAAEEALYGPRAEIWSDKIYLRFIDAILKNKKVSNDRKLRFKRHGEILRNSMIGAVPPEFDYELPTGSIAHYYPNGVITVIEFGDPDCDECRLTKLKLETDVQFSSLVDRGLVNVLFIIPDPDEGWNTKLADYSTKWHVGASDTVSDLYDMRSTPALYVIDSKGQIAAKNITVVQAMQLAADEANRSEK